MFRWYNGRIGFFSEDILRNERRDVSIETLDLGHAAAEDNDVGVENINNLS